MNDSGNAVDRQFEPITEEQFDEMYEKAARVNNDYAGPAPTSVGAFLELWANETSPRDLCNRRVWRRELPVEYEREDGSKKKFLTPDQAFGKIIFDAEFYNSDREFVKAVAKASAYGTTFDEE